MSDEERENEIENGDNEEENDEDNEEIEENELENENNEENADNEENEEHNEEKEENDEENEEKTKKKMNEIEKIKKTRQKDAASFRDKEKKKGVIYLSRIPPSMNPDQLRTLLEVYGKIGRIFLTPEDATRRKKRKKTGGNGRKNYDDGWVEFFSKKIAKQVALSLNNTPIGGSKKSKYREDLWNLRYLPNFKWDNLTDKQAYERRTRESKMRIVLTQAKKLNSQYLDQVDKSKMIKGMQQKKQNKEDKINNNNNNTNNNNTTTKSKSNGTDTRDQFEEAKKQFRQRQTVKRSLTDTDMLAKVLSDQNQPNKKRKVDE